jgi:hypothetical protein
VLKLNSESEQPPRELELTNYGYCFNPEYLTRVSLGFQIQRPVLTLRETKGISTVEWVNMHVSLSLVSKTPPLCQSLTKEVSNGLSDKWHWFWTEITKSTNWIRLDYPSFFLLSRVAQTRGIWQRHSHVRHLNALCWQLFLNKSEYTVFITLELKLF